jgi:hypothetical protein
MKTILAIAFVLASMASAAARSDDAYHLGSIPAQFRGIWCGTVKEGQYVRQRRKDCPDSSGDNIMLVTADGFSIEEDKCEATRIAIDNPKNPRRFWIRFRCEVPGSDSLLIFREWRLIEGRLQVITEEQQ